MQSSRYSDQVEVTLKVHVGSMARHSVFVQSTVGVHRFISSQVHVNFDTSVFKSVTVFV
jgi:hypothetical protein